jgi:hypothetical protein
LSHRWPREADRLCGFPYQQKPQTQTINCHISCVRAFYEYLQQEEALQITNPVRTGCGSLTVDVPIGLPYLRWNEAKESSLGDLIAEFGSEEFLELAQKLARENRQGSIALKGEVVLLVDGDTILVKNAN